MCCVCLLLRNSLVDTSVALMRDFRQQKHAITPSEQGGNRVLLLFKMWSSITSYSIVLR